MPPDGAGSFAFAYATRQRDNRTVTLNRQPRPGARAVPKSNARHVRHGPVSPTPRTRTGPLAHRPDRTQTDADDAGGRRIRNARRPFQRRHNATNSTHLNAGQPDATGQDATQPNTRCQPSMPPTNATDARPSWRGTLIRWRGDGRSQFPLPPGSWCVPRTRWLCCGFGASLRRESA